MIFIDRPWFASSSSDTYIVLNSPTTNHLIQIVLNRLYLYLKQQFDCAAKTKNPLEGLVV